MKNIFFGLLLASGVVSADDFKPSPLIDLDFSAGKRLDSQQWSRIVGVFTNNSAFYTSEDQNLSYDGNYLVIEARKQHYSARRKNINNNDSGAPSDSREISSASIISKQAFKYGHFEIVAKVPETMGVQPAIWLQGHDNGQYGEIDIMEAVGLRRPSMKFATVYAGTSPKTAAKQSANSLLPDGFHTYSLMWTPENITISYDGSPILRSQTSFGSRGRLSPLNQPMRLRMNLAIGTDWSGPMAEKDLPVTMKIKSIRYWEYGKN